jgi:hypothetical protein
MKINHARAATGNCASACRLCVPSSARGARAGARTNTGAQKCVISASGRPRGDIGIDIGSCSVPTM